MAYDAFKTRAAFDDWTNIIAGLLVIAFFGFGSEANAYYVLPFRWLSTFRDGRTQKHVEQVEGEDLKHDVTHVSFRMYVSRKAVKA